MPEGLWTAIDCPELLSTRRLAWPRSEVWDADGWVACPHPRAWDLFGYTRCAWNYGDLHAWDAFGFRIWAVGNEHQVKVLLQQPLERFSTFQTGEVTALRVGNDPTHVVVEVTRPYCCERCEWGLDIVASVRAMQHWVSRWRRGLRVFRKHNATMILSHKLRGLPGVLSNVLSCL